MIYHVLGGPLANTWETTRNIWSVNVLGIDHNKREIA